jgi:23S rRNA (cytosine1962-C5)-methyltransferase
LAESASSLIDAPGTASLLVPWRVERILRDDERFLIVDKPAGIVVHGGDEALADDLVHRVGGWLAAQGRDEYLGVHQRLDQATSGLLFFTRRRSENAAVARAMEEHRIERTYFAVVRLEPRHRLQKRGRLEHVVRHARGRTEVVTDGRGQRAVTDYEVVEFVGARALVRLLPRTGRTHQLRVQLAAVGAPICGDRSYGGEPAPRLFLHAAALGGEALGGSWSCPLPPEFGEFLATGRVTVGQNFEARLLAAGLRRFALRGTTSAYRLVNGEGDLLPSVVVDVYGAYAVLSLYDAALVATADELAATLVRQGFRGVYLKTRVRADLRHQRAAELAAETPLLGEAPPLAAEARAAPANDQATLLVEEHGMRIEVALGDGLSTGLFLDQRDNRQRVRAGADGRRVLNLFCYTGSFSVAAALGGAREVVSVDLAGRALERARRNFELNGLDPKAHRFFKEDAVKWLGRAGRRGERFALIVLDPPSFATVGKSTFSVDKRYAEVAALALGLLEPGGRLLAVTNHTRTTPPGLRRLLQGAVRTAGRQLRSLRDGPSGLDCPHAADGPWPSKSVWVTVE